MNNTYKMQNYLAFILCITPLLMAPNFYDYYYIPKIFSIYIICFLMIKLHLINDNKKSKRLDNYEVVLILYLALTLLSTIFSNNLYKAFWGKVGREEGMFAITSYIIIFLSSKSHFGYKHKYFKWILISSSLVSLYGISQYFGFDPIPRDPTRINWTGRAFSTIGNPNFLGAYLILMIPLPLYNYLKNREIHSLAVASIIYTCLLLTFTRSALIGFIVIFTSIILYVLKNRNCAKSFLIILVVFVILSTAVNVQSEGKLASRLFSIGRDAQSVIAKDDDFDTAGANRIYIWLKTIELIKERPLLGYGLENLEDIFVERYRDEMLEKYEKIYLVDRAHNEYLHIAVSSGIPALIIYIIFISMCIKQGFKLLIKDERYFPYFTAIIAYLIQAFFNISVVSVAYIFWVFLGIITNDRVFFKENYLARKTNNKLQTWNCNEFIKY